MGLLSRILKDDETDLRGAFAAIASISSIGIGIGITFPLLSFILDNRGYSGAVIGANAAMAGVSSMAAVWLVTPFVNRFGVTQTLIIAALIAAFSLMGFYLFDSIWVWFVLRATFHGMLTLSFVLSEFWINSASSEKNRGLMLGVYATVLSLGFGIGPAILSLTGSDNILPFIAGSAIILFAILPVLYARKREPVLDHNSGSANAFLRYVLLVPLATGAVFAFGAIEQANLSLMPVYAQRIGFSEYSASLLLVVLAAGNIIFQVPLGVLSDRIGDRRYVLYLCGAVGAVGTILIPWTASNTILLCMVLFVWGGTISGFYTIGLAHLGSRLKGNQLAEANSAFVLCYCVGMTLGPQLAGLSMDAYSPNGFIWTLFAFFALYLALCLVRGLTRSTG